MMLATLALLLVSPQRCTDIKRECRACTAASGKQRCSNIGIACQPVARLCHPKDAKTPVGRPRAAKPRER